jgi:hypothetical protein
VTGILDYLVSIVIPGAPPCHPEAGKAGREDLVLPRLIIPNKAKHVIPGTQ